MDTDKLYYEDSHMKEFDAVVTSCNEHNGHYAIELNRTAFFPEGGGQAGDVGTLNGVRVLDTVIRDGKLLHITEKPFSAGENVQGVLDWETRFHRMQNHTAEHIVSGLVYRRFGFHNVGFHMGADGVIVDFDGFVSPEELFEIEEDANRIITENRNVYTSFPAPDELETLEYRSKLDLMENVRLVIIDGCDVCACCAPHVSRTGEIGLLRIFESVKRRDGIRLRMLAGSDAFVDYRRKSEIAGKVSALLSAPPDELDGAVRRIISDRDKLAYTLGGLKRELIHYKTAELRHTENSLLFFEASFDASDAKLLCKAAIEYCGKVAAVFYGDEGGFKYFMMSRSVDLREFAAGFNAALRGKGGGSSEQISGFVSASRKQIETYFGI